MLNKQSEPETDKDEICRSAPMIFVYSFARNKTYTTMHTFANILYDEAFKVILANPANRELLIKLVEFFLPGKKIKELTLNDKEQHGLLLSSKNSTFDLFCTTDRGERLIIEMQFSSQPHFQDRMLYYATFPVHSQMIERLEDLQRRVEEGGIVTSVERMDYHLDPVYVISILNFSLPHESEDALEDGLISRYEIRNRLNGEPMTDALHFIYLELGRLRWKEDEQDKCKTLLDKLAFSFLYGHLLPKRPDAFEDEILRLLYKAMAFANMTKEQYTKITSIMRTELDIIAQRNYAYDQGKAEGEAEGEARGEEKGMKRLAEQLVALGVSPEIIQEAKDSLANEAS